MAVKIKIEKVSKGLPVLAQLRVGDFFTLDPHSFVYLRIDGSGAGTIPVINVSTGNVVRIDPTTEVIRLDNVMFTATRE